MSWLLMLFPPRVSHPTWAQAFLACARRFDRVAAVRFIISGQRKSVNHGVYRGALRTDLSGVVCMVRFGAFARREHSGGASAIPCPSPRGLWLLRHGAHGLQQALEGLRGSGINGDGKALLCDRQGFKCRELAVQDR